MRAWSIACLALAACSNTGSGTAIDLSLTFAASISDDALAQITTLNLRGTGDETDNFPITLGRAAQRNERIVYRPAVTTKSFGLVADAYSSGGASLAHGEVAPIAIASGQRTELSLALEATSVLPDGGAFDLSGQDGPLILPLPTFRNISLTSAILGNPLTVSLPSGTHEDSLLLAMVSVTANTTIALSITAPMGWTTLTSAASSTPSTALATWYWKFAGPTEPNSITFTRTNDVPGVLMVAAYDGISTTAPSPFDSPFAQVSPDTTPNLPTIHTNLDKELLVGNVVCPDDYAHTFTAPMGMFGRQSSSALSADDYEVPHGDTGVRNVSTGAPTTCRYFTLVTGLVGVASQ